MPQCSPGRPTPDASVAATPATPERCARVQRSAAASARPAPAGRRRGAIPDCPAVAARRPAASATRVRAWRRLWRGVWLLPALLAACSGPQGRGGASAAAPAGSATLQAPAGTLLAYEHTVRVEVAADRIGARVQAVQDACQRARFGDCAVLEVMREGGRHPQGSVTLRVAPAAIEPLIALAGAQGEIAARSVRAEDLAQQVADNGRSQARLSKEYARLQALQQRPNLAVADLLAVAQRLAAIETELEQAGQEAAQHRRRLDTQGLTIGFQSDGGSQGAGAIREAFAASGGIVVDSIAVVIRVLAGLLPVAVLALVAGVPLRGWWRRRRRKGA